MAYSPTAGVRDGTWVGAPQYTAPTAIAPGDWSGRVAIYPAGLVAGAVGIPPLVTKQQFIGPSSWQDSRFGVALATLDWQYIPPYASLDVAWTTAQAYTAPTSPFSAVWHVGPPAENRTLYPAGFEATEHGLPLVWWPQYVAPAGIVGTRFGYTIAYREGEYPPRHGFLDASWVGAQPYNPGEGWCAGIWMPRPEGAVWAYGFDHSRFGPAAKVWNHRQVVRPDEGMAPGAVGIPWVSLSKRRIRGGLAVQTRWGHAFLSGGVRVLDLAGRGVAATRWGNPTAWFRVRQLRPEWFVGTEYGATMVDRHHTLAPAGFAAGDQGLSEVHYPRSIVDLANLGMAATRWGADTTPWLQHRVVAPEGFTPYAGPVGQPHVELWQRYLHQLFEVTPYDGGVFGHFNYVRNRDREPRPEGVDMARYGEPRVANNARIVTTPPYQWMTRWGEGMVAYRIRHLPLAGFDASWWGRWTQVYNAAAVMAPQSLGDQATVGRPERVWSNLQGLNHAGGELQTRHGVGMVAYRVRTLVQYRMPAPPPMGLVTVQNWERPVSPAGIEPVGLGVPNLVEHFTIAYPASVMPPRRQVGMGGRVWNLTPEVGTRGATATAWGRPQVHNEWERYAIESFGGSVFGRHVVADRRLWIAPGGNDLLAFGPHAEVRNVMPSPPGDRTVAPVGWQSMGAGAQRFGRPTLRTNVLWPQGWDAAKAGVPEVTYFGIWPKGIHPWYPDGSSFFGRPRLPNTQTAAPASIVLRYLDQYGLPDVGPHYIWAPRGYPYTSGYYHEQGSAIDSEAVFGQVTVTLENRGIKQRHSIFDDFGVMTEYGKPALALRPQYVDVKGFEAWHRGIPVVLGRSRTLRTYGFEMGGAGKPAVAYAPYLGPQTVAPQGLGATVFGHTRAELFNRVVAAQGFNAFRVSAPEPPSWPRASTWVSHEYLPFEMVGFDATRWGTTWISHWVRSVEMSGWDSFVCDYTPGYFKDRMRVQERNAVRRATAGAVGAMGKAWVSQGERPLLIRGIRQDRVGTPQLRATWHVDATGWDSAAFGDVQRWDAGTIKPHGDDMARVGRAVINRVLYGIGWAGDVGTPRFAAGVRPGGIHPLTVPAPAVVAAVCGNKVVAAQGNDAAAFGSATVGSL